MFRLLLMTALVAGEGAPERPGAPVWSTAEAIEKGGDKTFVAKGTQEGHRYVLRARGICKREPATIWLDFPIGWVKRERRQPIFGIDFRAALGSAEARLLNVGDNRIERTELTFVADRDDVSIRLFDNWELPKDVVCTVDNIEVVVWSPPAHD